MKKNFGILIIVIVVAGLIWWAMSSKQAAAPSSSTSDTTTQIQSDLQGLDTASLDKEFQGIDADLNKL